MKVAADKDRSLAEVQASLEKARTAEDEAFETMNSRVAALQNKLEESSQTIEEKNARIKRLEAVRLTKDQVQKLHKLKEDNRNNAVENKELRKRLAVLEGLACGKGGAATELVAKLQSEKDAILKKAQEYGMRVDELERERARVRAAVEEAGVSVSVGGDLSDAVMEIADRAVGADSSMISSSFSGSEAAAISAAVAASERHRAEVEESRAALRKSENDRLSLKEKMMLGVTRFRELESEVTSLKERLEVTESEQAEAVSVAVKTKERELKFLQVRSGFEQSIIHNI